jgi:hypothetical protein
MRPRRNRSSTGFWQPLALHRGELLPATAAAIFTAVGYSEEGAPSS